MKRNIYSNTVKTILICIGIVGLSSCEDFLKENPRNFINPESFYKKQADAEAGVTGIYEAVAARNFVNSVHVPNHNNSEETYPFNFSTYDIGYDFAADNVWADRIWSQCYEGIKRANSFIDVMEVQEVNFSETLRDRLVGEAKFLRAFFYYVLVQYMGDVPLMTTATLTAENFYPDRDPITDVWAFVKNDLQEAIPVLPHKSGYSGGDVSRVNREAARVLLAKVLMIENNWTAAKVQVDSVMTYGGYDLEENIANNWLTANEHGKESIYEVDYNTAPFGNQLFQFSGPPSFKHPVTGGNVGNLFNGIAFSHFFYNSFSDVDTRKTLFIDTAQHGGPPARFFTNKYFDPSVMITTGANGPVNWVVFRYADVLLMKAEIENEINTGPTVAAYDAINEVRDRAQIPNLTAGLTYSQFLDSVFVERQKELFYEGHRFFDLKRRGYTFLTEHVVPAREDMINFVGFGGTFTIYESDMLLAIPVQELDANPNLEQNPINQ